MHGFDRALFRCCIAPPKVADSKKGKRRRINQSRKQEGHKVQFHLRVIGPHPNAQQGVRKSVPEPLGRDHQPGDASHQAEGNRRGKRPKPQAELELYRAHRHAADSSAQQPPQQLRRDGTGETHDLSADDKECPDPYLREQGDHRSPDQLGQA